MNDASNCVPDPEDAYADPPSKKMPILLSTWKLIACVASCAVAAVFNTWVIIALDSAPDSIASFLEVVWSVAPFGCSVVFAIVTRKDGWNSWIILGLVAALAAYDMFWYRKAFWFYKYELETLKKLPGLTFGGELFGFGLFFQWPVVLLAGFSILCRRIWVATRSAPAKPTAL